MNDDERAQWERQVADLAARCALLEQERDQARGWCESAWYAIDQMEAEIHVLRRLAWEGWERAMTARDVLGSSWKIRGWESRTEARDD